MVLLGSRFICLRHESNTARCMLQSSCACLLNRAHPPLRQRTTYPSMLTPIFLIGRYACFTCVQWSTWWMSSFLITARYIVYIVWVWCMGTCMYGLSWQFARRTCLTTCIRIRAAKLGTAALRVQVLSIVTLSRELRSSARS